MTQEGWYRCQQDIKHRDRTSGFKSLTMTDRWGMDIGTGEAWSLRQQSNAEREAQSLREGRG